MVTGPEHYRQAEARLEAAYRIAHPDSGHTDEDAVTLIGIALQRAQVHATLALAAAHVDASRVHARRPPRMGPSHGTSLRRR